MLSPKVSPLAALLYLSLAFAPPLVAYEGAIGTNVQI